MKNHNFLSVLHLGLGRGNYKFVHSTLDTVIKRSVSQRKYCSRKTIEYASFNLRKNLITVLGLYTDRMELLIGEFILISSRIPSSLRIEKHILCHSIFLMGGWTLHMVHYPFRCMSNTIYAMRQNCKLLQSLH